MKHSRHKHNLTLIEFIIASVIVAILALALIPLYTTPHQMWRHGEDKVELQRELSLALKAAADQLREARWAYVTDSGHAITFQNDETSGSLYLENNQLILSNSAGDTPVADHIADILFTPYASQIDIEVAMEFGNDTIQGKTTVGLRGMYVVGQWKFKEGSGEEIATYDSSPSNNNGALYNPLWTYDSSLGRDVLQLRSTSLNTPPFSYVKLPDSNSLNTGQQIAYEFQVKSLGFDTPKPTLYSRGTPSTSEPYQHLYIDSSNGSIVFAGTNGSDYQLIKSSSLQWETGQWYNVVILLDNQLQTASFWRNGLLVQSTTYDTPFLLENISGNGYLGIAMNSDSGELDSNTALNGEFSEVTIGKN